MGGGVSRSAAQGSKIYVLSSEPKEHTSFCPGARPGKLVTGVTGKSFMCQSFMCLFFGEIQKGTAGRLSVNSPALILSKNSGGFLAKIG